MWYPAEIVISSYLPPELEVGMLFVNRISVGVIEPFVELFELEELPEDPDAFMSRHGVPVELSIIDEDGDLLASHDEIGWWDEGDDSDEYRNITLDDINYLEAEQLHILLRLSSVHSVYKIAEPSPKRDF